jgi:hypothetical protein
MPTQAIRRGQADGRHPGVRHLLFLWLYPCAEVARLAFTGPIGRWLDVHVTTALGLPMLLTIHAAWRAEGVIGLGFV